MLMRKLSCEINLINHRASVLQSAPVYNGKKKINWDSNCRRISNVRTNLWTPAVKPTGLKCPWSKGRGRSRRESSAGCEPLVTSEQPLNKISEYKLGIKSSISSTTGPKKWASICKSPIHVTSRSDSVWKIVFVYFALWRRMLSRWPAQSCVQEACRYTETQTGNTCNPKLHSLQLTRSKSYEAGWDKETWA